MISLEETIAGLAFLERHAPDECKSAIALARGACLHTGKLAALEELRARPYDDLELSVRALNGLGHIGCKTIRDVEELVALPDDVVFLRGKKVYFGKKCLRETREVLKRLGLEARR